MKTIVLLGCFMGLLIAITAFGPPLAGGAGGWQAATPTADGIHVVPTLEGEMVSPSDRLAPPPTVFPPTQADQGAQVYYLVCMVCHGDRGQGLTDEWRNVLQPPDNDCWRSKCHAPNHPPGGFVFPHEAPAVTGTGFLQGFGNALNLHNFIQTKMPWQAPGSLKPEEYWQLTAYLMRLNGYNLGSRTLDVDSARAIDFTAKAPQPEGLAGWQIGALIVGGIVILGAGYYIWRRVKVKNTQ